MFEIIFGLLFAGIPTMMLFTLTQDEISEGVPFGVFILFIGVFFITGAIFFLQGAKRIKRNIDTKRHGYIGYGEVLSINPTGTRYNDRPELAATVRVYIPGLNIIMTLSEVAGIGNSPYEVGSIVAVKYWNYDINILNEVTDPFSLPRRVQEILLGRAVLKEEENHNEWDKVDTDNWTLAPEAFPEDMSFDRLKDDETAGEEDDPPTVIRLPEKMIAGNLFKEFLYCVIVYAVVVLIAMIIK